MVQKPTLVTIDLDGALSFEETTGCVLCKNKIHRLIQSFPQAQLLMDTRTLNHIVSVLATLIRLPFSHLILFTSTWTISLLIVTG